MRGHEMVQFRGGFLVVVVVVVVVAALNLKAQVLWVDLGVSDPSVGSKFKLCVCISEFWQCRVEKTLET